MDYIVEKEIDGVIYKARYNGIAYTLELGEQAEADNSSFHLAEKLFNEVLVSPDICIDDFDDIETYSKVFAFLLNTANGVGIGKKHSKTSLKRRARDNWALWRLIFESEGAFSYQEVFGKPYMTPQDATEANFALDMVIDARRKAARRK